MQLGKPKQQTELTGKDDGPVNYEADVRAMIAMLMKLDLSAKQLEILQGLAEEQRALEQGKG
jgi:hypothetical protein